MIEMLGVLAIVGVLSVAGIAGYSKAMAKYKTNKLIDQVSTIVANVQTKVASIGREVSFEEDSAYNLGIYPEDIAKECDLKGKYETGCTRHVLGGELVVNYGSNPEIYGGIDVAVKVMSKDICATLVMTDWGPTLAGFNSELSDNADNAYEAILNMHYVVSVSDMSSKIEMVDLVCDGFDNGGGYVLMTFR